jgi:hypothetical protein
MDLRGQIFCSRFFPEVGGATTTGACGFRVRKQEYHRASIVMIPIFSKELLSEPAFPSPSERWCPKDWMRVARVSRAASRSPSPGQQPRTSAAGAARAN